MFFLASKLLAPLTDPADVMALFTLAGTVCVFLRRRRSARICLAFAGAILVVFGILPVADWLTWPLEERFPANPSLPSHVAGVIALGGTERIAQSIAWGQPSLRDPAPIAALMALGRRYPQARLVFSGGSEALGGSSESEAQVVRDFLDWIGVDRQRLIYEERSRNTYENAQLSRALLGPRPGETWILVTDALSMPRAVGTFRKAGWTVIAYPAGYTTAHRNSLISGGILDGLGTAGPAIHEWVGLLVYRLLGYSDALFPE